jgi:L-serine/L-threonine ammonia-lyase
LWDIRRALQVSLIVILMCERVGWKDVPVLACETEGAASFSGAVAKGELITLDGITSIARSLGAKRVCKEVLDWSKKHKIVPHLVTDRMTLDAICQFLEDQRILVEPACGAGNLLISLFYLFLT